MDVNVITWQGPYGPYRVKRYSLQSQQFLSAHSLCRAKRGGVRLDVLCPCLRCAVRHCQIQNNLVQVQLAERQVALLGFIGFLCWPNIVHVCKFALLQAHEEMYMISLSTEMHLITLCWKRSKSKSPKSSGSRIWNMLIALGLVQLALA